MLSKAAFRFQFFLGLGQITLSAIDHVRLLPPLWGLHRGQSALQVPAIGAPASIPVAGQTLEGWLVNPDSKPGAAVLILHGIGDRLVYWRRAQLLLASKGIASLVFHYSGYGGSRAGTTPANLERDVQAAYTWLVHRVEVPIYLLGFSLAAALPRRSGPIFHLFPPGSSCASPSPLCVMPPADHSPVHDP